MKHRWLGMAGLLLLLAELVLILLSWILSATGMEGVRSLLSSEGVRWFFGNFTVMVASPLLVWLLLFLIALGTFQRSGLVGVLRRFSLPSYRDRIAMRMSLMLLVAYLVVIALLTVFPHAILLSATGQLFPSAFSRSLVPVVAFGVVLVSLTFGMMSGRFRTMDDILDVLSFGIQRGAPLLVLYILAIQFCQSLRFVFA